ncbi:hypothetical protein ACKWTF_012676 [Chironomus riparius]
MLHPEVNKLYMGTITDVNKHGLNVKLNGFSKPFEGFIHNLELMGDLKELIVGDLIKVRIVSDANQFLSMTIRNVEQPANKHHCNDENKEVKRTIRVASPGRREIAQFTNSRSGTKVNVIIDDPRFLKRLSNSVISPKIPKQINIFRNQHSSMAKVAKAKM